MNILFLDYDGVVNTPMWECRNGKMICRYCSYSDNKVNNYQAVQWVSEFCEKYNYKIVVTSTWRTLNNYAQCLKNGGLRNTVEIIGRTPSLSTNRSNEIKDYLNSHSNVKNYIIVDDDIIENFDEHFVLCTQDCGFNLREFAIAEKLHNNQISKGGE